MADFNPSSSPAPFWNTVLRYGGLGALALIALSILWYLLDVNVMSLGNMALQFILIFGITIAFSIVATRHQRDNLDGGYISYGRALVIGLLLTAVAIIGSSLWNYILMNFIDPGYVDNLKEKFIDAWGESMPADALEKAVDGFDKSAELGTNLINGGTMGLIFGLIVGLISAAFMKRNPPIE